MDPKFLTLAILAFALLAFVAEWLPVDITALIIALLLMALGLVTPEEGISGFGNSATITVLLMFVLSAGISKTGVLQIVRDFLIRWGGDEPLQTDCDHGDFGGANFGVYQQYGSGCGVLADCGGLVQATKYCPV